MAVTGQVDEAARQLAAVSEQQGSKLICLLREAFPASPDRAVALVEAIDALVSARIALALHLRDRRF